MQVRWLYEGVQVDVMPTDPRILGFSNEWYPAGMATAQLYSLPSGAAIRILQPAYLLATKFCALNNRAGDLRWSSDWEDIVYVLEERHTLLAEVAATDTAVRTYVATQCAAILHRANHLELLEAVMSRGGSLSKLKQTLEKLAAPSLL